MNRYLAKIFAGKNQICTKILYDGYSEEYEKKIAYFELKEAFHTCNEFFGIKSYNDLSIETSILPERYFDCLVWQYVSGSKIIKGRFIGNEDEYKSMIESNRKKSDFIPLDLEYERLFIQDQLYDLRKLDFTKKIS